MKKDKKVAPEPKLIEELEADEVELETEAETEISGTENFQAQQAVTETKIREDLKVQSEILRRGMVVQMVDLSYIQEETNYFLVKGKVMTDMNGVPLFTEVTLKLTKSCLAKFILDAKSLIRNMEED